jgi:Mg2+ and Co2+ transporter CorA
MGSLEVILNLVDNLSPVIDSARDSVDNLSNSIDNASNSIDGVKTDSIENLGNVSTVTSECG